MPPFDREGALKSAEKALKLGRIDAAIADYVRIVEAQPRDWNSANALGDLYVRAGQVEKGIGYYVRIADHLATEGFYPKAAALYKKIIKFKPGEESALLQLGDIAARQGLLADAKLYFNQLADRRKARGDHKGAAELSVPPPPTVHASHTDRCTDDRAAAAKLRPHHPCDSPPSTIRSIARGHPSGRTMILAAGSRFEPDEQLTKLTNRRSPRPAGQGPERTP